jgi:hypothetical protein
MECPVCGSECEEIKYIKSAVNFEELADHIFSSLLDKGYAVAYDDINMILDIIDEYMLVNGECDDDSESS